MPKNEQTYRSPFLPPPPSSKNPVKTEAPTFDYLSGDTYNNEERILDIPKPPSPPKYDEPVQTSFPPKYNDDEPKFKESIQGPKSTSLWEAESSSTFLPPPPAKYNQRQQFFEKQQTSSGGNSYNGLVGQTQNLSLNQAKTNTLEAQGALLMDDQDESPVAKVNKPEDSLFKDLVDFAKAKSSSPPKPSGSRRTR